MNARTIGRVNGMIIGAIDVGTNSVKLLVAQRRDGGLRTLAHRAVITRLGAGLDKTGILKLDATDRTLQALSDFKELCDRLGCDRVVAVGTEALRRARNAKEFIERCEYEAGLRLRVIDGREEATLSFSGATADWPDRLLAAVDVGGGSTEIIVGRAERLSFFASRPLGAVSLTEKYFTSDPPREGEVERARKAIRRGLPLPPDALREPLIASGNLVGVGGTSITLAAILAKRRPGRPRLHGMAAQAPEIDALFSELAAMPSGERRRIEGLEPDRADIIVGGLLILIETMRALTMPRLLVSQHGLRRGLILEEARGRS
ncbi:MAG: Ppx/GppA family phosphatase [Planctomycetes bacterium]|nr:Ppx/GppA family phosphatase [Planctomycetota bacterium]